MSAREEAAALYRFEISRVLRRAGTWIGLLFFCVVTVAGHWEQWNGAVPRGPSELFGFAYGAGLVALLSFGVAQDRNRHFDEFLTINLIQRQSYVLAKLAALATALAAFGLVCAVIEGTAAGGAAGVTLWHAFVLVLSAIALAPFALIVEALVDTSIPAAPVLLAYAVLTAVLFLTTGSRLLADLPGFTRLVTGEWDTTVTLLVRTAVIAIAGFLIGGSIVAVRLRRY